MKFTRFLRSFNLIFVIVAGIMIAGCQNFNSAQPEETPLEPKLAVEVVSGMVQVGDIVATKEIEAGETISAGKGERFSTGDAGGAELRLSDGTLLQLAPDTILSIKDWEEETSITVRQFSGSVVFEQKKMLLTAIVSVAASFGLDRVEFEASAPTSGAKFQLDVDGAQVEVSAHNETLNITVNGAGYTLNQGDSLNVDSSTQVFVSQAIDPTPDAIVETTPEISGTPSGSGNNVARTQSPQGTDLSNLYSPPTQSFPPDNNSFQDIDDIKLSWISDAPLDADTWFEVQLWNEDDIPFKVAGRVQESNWQPAETLPPGQYQWRIRLVRISDGQYLSQPSAIGNFEVVEFVPTPTPIPVVNVPAPPPTAEKRAESFERPNIVGPLPAETFPFDKAVTLRWQSVGTLAENQWYEIRLWREGTEWLGVTRMKETQYEIPAEYNPGRYGWAVAVIKVENGEYVADISPQTQMRQFNWEAQPIGGGNGGNNGDATPTPPTER